MRLLGWINHKLRQSSVEPFKEFTKGNYCNCLTAQSPVDEQLTKTKFGSRFSDTDKNYDEETSKMSEIFDGFLAIGTLGSEPINEPETPTFPLEDIGDDKEEVSQYDLQLINEELEKFFEAEEEGCNESLGRSSYVSTVTLSGMQEDGASAEDGGKTAEVCPLQGYLFGSSIGAGAMKEKASLGELFSRTKMAEERSKEKEKGEVEEKREQKSGKQLMKKIMKKFHGYVGNPNSSSGDETASFFSTKKKINKVLKMFHRKVHPEQSMVEKESHEEKRVNYDEKQSNMKMREYGLIGSHSSNKEYWIKTDSEYLVLEL